MHHTLPSTMIHASSSVECCATSSGVKGPVYATFACGFRRDFDACSVMFNPSCFRKIYPLLFFREPLCSHSEVDRTITRVVSHDNKGRGCGRGGAESGGLWGRGGQQLNMTKFQDFSHPFEQARHELLLSQRGIMVLLACVLNVKWT